MDSFNISYDAVIIINFCIFISFVLIIFIRLPVYVMLVLPNLVTLLGLKYTYGTRISNICVVGGSPPRIRAYLYGTLLYYLQIAQKPKPINISVTGQLIFCFTVITEFTVGYVALV